jgi:cytochrome c oxidase cbb3-type subunit 3
LSKDTNRLLGHSDEADGIDEYDNPLPDWWVGLFWLTIVWAIGYGIHYHFIANRSFEQALADEMAAAEARWPAEAAAAAAAAAAADFTVTPELVSAGEQVYNTQCIACHAPNLEGLIGPSFVDDEWIHGRSVADILRTIRQGVPEKGMVPWGPILSAQQINEVAAFVIQRNMDATGRTMDDFMGAGEGG